MKKSMSYIEEIHNKKIKITYSRFTNMKTTVLLLYFVCILSNIFSQTVPAIKGETIDNKNISIPDDLKGKYSLICIASSMNSQKDLEGWLDPVYQKYIAKTGLMDDMYDVNVYFIPVLTGTNLSFATSMKKKFKENAQEDLRPHVLFCTENGKEVLSALNINNTDVPYFFLLNKDSNIIFRTSGRFTEEKFDAIDDLIE